MKKTETRNESRDSLDIKGYGFCIALLLCNRCNGIICTYIRGRSVEEIDIL